MFLNRKRPTTFIANIAGMNPLKFFIESIGIVFQTLKKYQKRKKNTKFPGSFQFQSSPNFIPRFPFFFEQCCGFQRFCTPQTLRHQTSPSSLGFLEGASNLSSRFAAPEESGGGKFVVGDLAILCALFGMVK